MQKIINDFLTVEISEKGAEIQSIKNSDGVEYIWNGDPAYWTGRAPVLFPICGGLKEDKYTCGGMEYTLPKHGFGKNKYYTVESAADSQITFLLCSDEDTKKAFPFDFELRITYVLDGNKLNVTYAVANVGDNDMFFSIGSHEAYAIPEGIENYHIQFDKNVTLNAYKLNGNIVENEYITVLENSNKLPLNDEFFAIDALVFRKIDFSKAALVSNNGNRKVTVEFPGCDYFLLWKKPQAKFLCLEPWAGIPDITGSDYDISKKEGIMPLGAGKEYIKQHTITFE